MSLLESPEALALLADVKVPLAAVQGGVRRLAGFIERYQPLFYRTEQRHWAEVVLEGRLSNLDARPTSRSLGKLARHASRCKSSSAPANGPIAPCWTSCTGTWPQRGATTTRC